jgi:hypothetical protein
MQHVTKYSLHGKLDTWSHRLHRTKNKVLTTRRAFGRVYWLWLFNFRRAAPRSYYAQQPLQKRQAISIYRILRHITWWLNEIKSSVSEKCSS